MFKKRPLVLVVLMTFVMLLMSPAAKAATTTITVGSTSKLKSALTSGKNVTILNGHYIVSSLNKISSNIVIQGQDNTVIDGNNSMAASLNGVHDVEFKNLKFKNMGSMELLNSYNIKFTNVQFDNLYENGVVMDNFKNVEFNNCTISNVGSTKVDVTWEGMGLALTNGDGVKIHDSEIYNTYGHGAIFLTNNSNMEIYKNKIHDTFYRGIELYDSGNTGSIHHNNIYNTGSINTTDSGVGCNGIYADSSSDQVDILNNNISNVIENGIEGIFKSVEYNTINGTGIDMKNHPTPSGEGIYGLNGIYVGNIVKNSYGPGIKAYSEDPISNLTIIQNSIYDTVASESAININSEAGYSNVNISGNTSYNNNYCVYVRYQSAENLNVTGNTAEGSNVLITYLNN